MYVCVCNVCSVSVSVCMPQIDIQIIEKVRGGGMQRLRRGGGCSNEMKFPERDKDASTRHQPIVTH